MRLLVLTAESNRLAFNRMLIRPLTVYRLQLHFMMEAADSTNYKRKRENTGIITILLVCTALSLLISIAALSLSGYYGVRITKLEEEQRVLQTIIRNFADQGTADHALSRRSLENEAEAEEALQSIHAAWLRGAPGRDGRDGQDGKDGKDGRDCSLFEEEVLLQKFNESIGHAILRKVQLANSKLNTLDEYLNTQESTSGSAGVSVEDGNNDKVLAGSTYVRWGRTACGSESELLYEGFVAGQHYTHRGGAANYECLPLDPEYSKVNPGTSTGTFIYGAEYEHSGTIFRPGTDNENVPCARCYAAGRAAKMMIPAKRSCPLSWTKEYEGYLMTEHHTHYRRTYACMDANPEYVPGRGGNENGALFYFVQASCDSTGHCPPYREGEELTCVVCSK